ncbi:Rab geranylgeranyltransferase beta subunit [Paragonimus heterotremus]|uniref:Galactose mutarotase n=1 Tax=Paragonimus heterotremus TaxID=100268 RepID=A0A8J4SL34_9TREM|nr:Rab geranylgeranyltransferase beta subunit [Paragonimus heterotremus]
MAHPIVDTILEETMPKELYVKRHTEFLSAYEKKDDCTLDFLKLSGIFWTLTALDLLGELNLIDQDAVIKLVLSCQQSDGGFSPAPSHDSHLLSTLSGIQILALFDRIDHLDKNAVVRYILSLQQPDGSFYGDQWGEIDTRFSFCAIASLHLLGQLDECVSSGRLNKEACATYLERCQNLDGGFGTKPGSESHAGQAYCVVGTLAILQELRRLDLERAAWWLAERQLPSGGINGRPEKKPDVCYSWWALATLTILGKIAWINDRNLIRFILAAQDPETGGIADRPGDIPDPFHTLFGLAGLSLIAQANSQFSSRNNVVEKNGDYSGKECSMEDDHVSTALWVAKTRLKPINPVFWDHLIRTEGFGKTSKGELVQLITINTEEIPSIGQRAYVQVCTLGAAVVACCIPGRDTDGKLTMMDVALGYKDAASYERNPAYLGVIVGRVAGRVQNGQFKQPETGEIVHLTRNSHGTHCVHGGR